MNRGVWPQRIACLSAESADICARLGVWDRVVGVTAFANQVGLEPRPVLSGFSRADAGRVLAVQPDLIFTFSDVQAEISAELIRSGATVIATNPRTLTDIADSIVLIGRSIGAAADGDELARSFMDELEKCLGPNSAAMYGPRVYFEEWPDPIITGIPWVGEILERAGGKDVFAGNRGASAKERIVTPRAVIDADPEIIFASWCGKPVDVSAIRERPGFEDVSAVRGQRIVSIDGADILQPGPGLVRGAAIVADAVRKFCEESTSSR